MLAHSVLWLITRTCKALLDTGIRSYAGIRLINFKECIFFVMLQLLFLQKYFCHHATYAATADGFDGVNVNRQ